MTELRTIKELCGDLRRGRTYVQAVKTAMTASGTPWIGNRIATADILVWLREHPEFRTSDFGRRSHKRGKRKARKINLNVKGNAD